MLYRPGPTATSSSANAAITATGVAGHGLGQGWREQAVGGGEAPGAKALELV